jgi:hypothetical protein
MFIIANKVDLLLDEIMSISNNETITVLEIPQTTRPLTPTDDSSRLDANKSLMMFKHKFESEGLRVYLGSCRREIEGLLTYQ